MNPGERIGDYEIVAVLGAGGMGQVYKVRNVLSDRIEAIKVLLPNLTEDPDLAERFQREIKVQAGLDHPNIARLHTAFVNNNQLIMVMEFVEGSTIEQLLQGGPLPTGEALNYTGQVLDALGYAHGRGVVHRDIKPSNIMRASSGTVKLMDFGIARSGRDSRVTRTGMAVGSPAYMAPEQIQGAEPDPRSDLYSLGIALYEMVTGIRPFAGDSDYAIMAAHMQQAPVAPLDVVPGLPAEVSDLILRALAKDPADRFQSAQAFRDTLGGPKTVTLPIPSIPAAAPVPAPPPPLPLPDPAPAIRAGSPRGLYMAIGSVVTIAVLAVAIVQGPKWMRSGASTAAPQQVGQPLPAEPAQAAPVQAPSTPVQAAPVAPVQPAAVKAVQKQNPVARQAPSQEAPPVQVQIPAAGQAPGPASVTAPQPSVQAPRPPQAAEPARPAASPELAQLRELHNLISVRAGAARSGLNSLRQRMRGQGLDLRGDIAETETRMNYLLQEAMMSIVAGDVEGGRRSLQMGERALETIEKFLGR